MTVKESALSGRKKGMNNEPPTQSRPPDGLHNFHLKLITKVTLFTGLSAAVVLLVLLFVVSKEGQVGYWQIIQAHTITRMQLGSFMLVAALLLLIVVGISVWLVSLYSSFRIAGPIYRLGQNIQAAISFGPQQDIRCSDELQDVAHDLRVSAEALLQHYQQLQLKVDDAINHLDAQDTVALVTTLKELKALESAVKLDD